MKIRPMGGELFHMDEWTDRETDRQTWRSEQLLYAICRTRLKNRKNNSLVNAAV